MLLVEEKKGRAVALAATANLDRLQWVDAAPRLSTVGGNGGKPALHTVVKPGAVMLVDICDVVDVGKVLFAEG